METSKEQLTQKASNVSVLDTNVGLADPELVRSIFEAHARPGIKALIICGWATGTVHKNLIPLIQETTVRGVSVFVLSNNPKDEQGIRRLKYEPHFDTVAAGAILLRDVNINRGDEVLSAIQDEIDQGKTGNELNEAIAKRFGTPISSDPK